MKDTMYKDYLEAVFGGDEDPMKIVRCLCASGDDLVANQIIVHGIEHILNALDTGYATTQAKKAIIEANNNLSEVDDDCSWWP